MAPEGFRADPDPPAAGHVGRFLGGCTGLEGMGESFIPLGQCFDLLNGASLVLGLVAAGGRGLDVSCIHGNTLRS
jgi:hypothetical protein